VACEALEPCVTLALNAMTAAGLDGFCAALRAERALIDQQLLKQQAQLLKYDFLALAVDAEQAVANAALDAVQDQLGFFPTNLANLIVECVDLGVVLTSPQEVLGDLRALVNEQLTKLREYASFSEELGQAIQRLQELSQLLQDVVDCATHIATAKRSVVVS
jgi:hypothetical protein